MEPEDLNKRVCAILDGERINRPMLDWTTCEQSGCIGIRLAAGRTCLAHASAEERAAALLLVGETGTIDARGVPMTRGLLEQVLAACPRLDDKVYVESCQFDGATFTGAADFSGATFAGSAKFNGVTFTGAAVFPDTTCTDIAWFQGATFNSNVNFARATFTWADFGGATFARFVEFSGASFTDFAGFLGVTFTGSVNFDKATFTGFAWFGGATFTGPAGFDGATFDRADFGKATFTSDSRFNGARISAADFGRANFEQARELGPLLADKVLVLDDAQFKQPIQIEASTARLLCRRAQFPAGVQFRLRWAQVVLDDANFPAPSLLTGIPRLTSESLADAEAEMAKDWSQEVSGGVHGQPQLLSLQRANVAGLGLGDVNVADCRFAGAHNLDKLRLEAGVAFETAPTRMGRLNLDWREVIAEERAWRVAANYRRWAAPGWPPWLDDQQPRELQAGQIAGLYRGLRKGREDIKDEPGAADFYYGEMEMRRHAGTPQGGDSDGKSSGTSRGRFGRGVLTAYWLVSGYGLRAWRAVACLAVVTAIFAFAFHLWGFTKDKPPQPASYWTSLLYAFRATLSLPDTEVTLTAVGKLLQGLLRLTGPVLLGLALLALRGRVKR